MQEDFPSYILDSNPMVGCRWLTLRFVCIPPSLLILPPFISGQLKNHLIDYRALKLKCPGLYQQRKYCNNLRQSFPGLLHKSEPLFLVLFIILFPYLNPSLSNAEPLNIKRSKRRVLTMVTDQKYKDNFLTQNRQVRHSDSLAPSPCHQRYKNR